MSAGPGPAEPAGHDTALPYSDELVPGDAIDVSRWDWWSHTDAGIVHYYAAGPCPACRGHTQDHRTDLSPPVEGLGPDATPPSGPSDTIEMLLQCHCGSAHGQPDARGCGRRWSLIGARS